MAVGYGARRSFLPRFTLDTPAEFASPRAGILACMGAPPCLSESPVRFLAGAWQERLRQPFGFTRSQSRFASALRVSGRCAAAPLMSSKANIVSTYQKMSIIEQNMVSRALGESR